MVLLAAGAEGGFLNGNFSNPGISPEPFADWSTETAFFDRPSDGGGYALFDESGTVGSSQLAQSFALASGAFSISFELNISALGTASGSSVPDSFQATLFSNSGALFPSNPANPLLFPAFYSIDSDGTTESFDSTYVSTLDLGGGFKRVTLSGSLTGQSLTIDFLLNGLPDGITTQVQLDNVELNQFSVVPEPASSVIWLSMIGLVYASRRRKFSRSIPTFYGLILYVRARLKLLLGDWP